MISFQDALRQLWRLAYPHRDVPPLKSELWKDMGWQGPDPSTDFRWHIIHVVISWILDVKFNIVILVFFRSGGFISLENLIFFAENYPVTFICLLMILFPFSEKCLWSQIFLKQESFHRLLHKLDGKRSEWEYPFAAAGVNLSFMLTQMLGLKSGNCWCKTLWTQCGILDLKHPYPF